MRTNLGWEDKLVILLFVAVGLGAAHWISWKAEKQRSELEHRLTHIIELQDEHCAEGHCGPHDHGEGNHTEEHMQKYHEIYMAP